MRLKQFGNYCTNLENYFNKLVTPPSDVNLMMMYAWSKSLNLKYCIENEIMYIFSEFDGQIFLWSPPLGQSLRIEHIFRAFEMLSQLNPANCENRILSCWREYPLWGELIANDDIEIESEESDYIYSTSDIGLLKGKIYEELNRVKNRFRNEWSPSIYEFSRELIPECLTILEKWKEIKVSKVASKYRYRLELECDACRYALESNLPLKGIVCVVNNIPIGFSVGYKHDSSSFLCMFEKTGLSYKDAPTFIFSELGKYCLYDFIEINSCDDWGIPYLQVAKKKWHPKLLRTSLSIAIK